MAIACGKTRPKDKPYEVWRAGEWEWRVLKKYQNDDSKPYARALCVVTSPFTTEAGDMGDVYLSDIRHNAYLVSTDY